MFLELSRISKMIFTYWKGHLYYHNFLKSDLSFWRTRVKLMFNFKYFIKIILLMFSYIHFHLSRKDLKTLILCYFLSTPLSFLSFNLFQNFSKRFSKYCRFKIKNHNLALKCWILATISLFSTIIKVRALTNRKNHQSYFAHQTR